MITAKALRAACGRVAITLAVGAIVSLSACSAGESVVGGDAGFVDVASLVDTGDSGIDVNAVEDSGVVTDTNDSGSDLGPQRCTSDAMCAGDPVGTVCDLTSGQCVACTPTNDVCPRGQYCIATMNVCAHGCGDDTDCTGGGGGDDGGVDGGSSPGVCDTTTHQCVACLQDAHCPAGMLCVGNLCVTGCSATHGCAGTQACCDGACIDTQSSTAHCGACGAACTVPNGTPTCSNGTCAVGLCTVPFADCNGDRLDGCEVDTSRDVLNCGGCGSACPTRANASAGCTVGRCGFVCTAGFADCDGDAENGCEVDLRASNGNCGGCGVVCNPPNAMGACAMGTCTVVSCTAEFGDCDNNATNGCEADLRSTTAHCGACDHACAGGANAVGVCAASRCALVCAAGFADCDGDASNGCEVATTSDAMHCGACGRACARANTETQCVGSRCTVTGCTRGYGDCDAMAENGCETHTEVSVANCGRCGVACATPPGGSAVCAGGNCGVTCAMGRGDCDGNVANGCEVNLGSDVMNCGACGRRGTEVCNGADDDCDGIVDEGFSATGCVALGCTGSGLVYTIPDGCMDDGGASSGGDALQVFCVDGISRFCLSGEACPWRSGQVTSQTQSCSHSGLSGSNYMASAGCSRWNGHANYYCDSAGRIYFP